MSTESSIIDIFNKMNYKDREAKNTDYIESEELYDLDEFDEIKSLETAIFIANHANNMDWTWELTLHQRALLLLDIGRRLSEEADRLSKLHDFRGEDYSLLIDFFNYYSNMCYKLDTNWRPCDHVLVVLSSDVPFFILGGILAAAFGAGCPVIVLYSIEKPWFLLFLKQVFSSTTLPKHFFNFVPNCESNKADLEKFSIQKTVFLGNHLSAKDLCEWGLFTSFSLVSPNNTATFILEFCDLDTAIDKIFYETWNKKFATMWGVSTAVVQESVYKKFLDRLESRIDQLTDEQERALIKNCIIPAEDEDREKEPNLPVLKVLSCRTANEGVNILNSYQYYVGTSIWSENSSQALEIASKLICKNIWINCHGIIEPSVPFQSSNNNGNVVFGGYEGILEYVNIFKDFIGSGKSYEISPERIQVEETVLSAQKAFKKWLLTENKGMYLTKIAESLKNHSELSDLSETVIDVLSMENTNTVSRSCNRNFYIIHEKFPVGVIAMLFEDFDLRCLVYSITTAIASGNAVVVALRKKKPLPLVKPLVDVFNTHLPSGLLNVIIEEEHTIGILLASQTEIQAVWLYPESERFPIALGVYPPCHINTTVHKNNYGMASIKRLSSITLKRFWPIRDLPEKFHPLALIYQRECLSNKIIWLTKVDQFP